MNGQQLQADRLRRALTWRDYAKLLGVSPSTLFNIVAGKRPNALTQAKIQKALRGGK